MQALATVHTAGVNWDSVVAIVASVVVIMTAVFGLVARYVTTKITGSIDRFRIDVFEPLEGRVTVLEVGERASRHRRRLACSESRNATRGARCALA